MYFLVVFVCLARGVINLVLVFLQVSLASSNNTPPEFEQPLIIKLDIRFDMKVQINVTDADGDEVRIYIADEHPIATISEGKIHNVN